MAQETIFSRILTFVDSCISTPIDKLIYNSNWGSINFEQAKKELEKLFSMLNHLKILPIELLPEDVANQILNQGTPVLQTIEQIRKFSVEQANPVNVKNNLISSLTNQINDFYKVTQIWIPYLAYQKGDVQKNIEILTKSVQLANSTLEEAKKDIEKKSKEIDQIISIAREASASVGVAHFTADFSKEATDLEEKAKIWLTATGVFASVTLLLALLSILFINIKDITTTQLIQLTTTKLLVLAILISATVWCGKIYKANKHLSIINKHRANSLKTFQAFMKAAENNYARDAVLLETTKAIFSLSPTGYLDNESSQLDASTKVVEFIKNGSQILAKTS
jgi:CRISPR/Cas system CSM-associated protein Csm2 small subunit